VVVRGPGRRVLGRLLLSSLSVAVLLAVGVYVAAAYVALPAWLEACVQPTLRIEDRSGTLLAEVPRGGFEGARAVREAELSPTLVLATLAAEDARFYAHPGVDVLAVARALLNNLRSGEQQGASTLTQQLVAQYQRGLPALRAWRPKSWLDKLSEAWWALVLERHLTKGAILTRYLNVVSYGHNTRGVESAALYYLGRSSSELSLAQATFLAAIPCGVSYFDPQCHPERTRERQRWILRRLAKLGMITAESLASAWSEPIVLAAHDETVQAPHFVASVQAVTPGQAVRVRSTLDLRLQRIAQTAVSEVVRRLRDRGANGGAVVVLDNRSGEVLALVGSPDFYDQAADGQVNLANALRQPGSTLKPFLYELALERGYTPATLLDDGPFRSSDGVAEYEPSNYDGKHHGKVRLRVALACSYNLPAVRVLQRLGVAALLDRLHALGFTSLREPPEHYGLALTLGAGEVTLLELTAAYAALARAGRPVHPVLCTQWQAERSDDWQPVATRAVVAASGSPSEPAPHTAAQAVMDPRCAFQICDILSDNEARAPAFGFASSLALPFACAVKTGTSRDYRDNWCVGCTPRYTVGAWVGNTRGAPMHGVSGVAGAAPIVRDVALALHSEIAQESFEPPQGLVRAPICLDSGLAPEPGCRHRSSEWLLPVPRPQGAVLACPSGHGARRAKLRGWRILVPEDGASYSLDPHLSRDQQAIYLSASREVVRWKVDGRALDGVGGALGVEPCWILRPGSHVVEALDAAGRVERARFRVR
jgi:penicillin-binding protein 1C